MHRSQSTTSTVIPESKTKKFWKSLTLKEKSTGIPKSSSTLRVSSPINTLPMSTTPKELNERHTTTALKAKNRSSMILLPESRSSIAVRNSSRRSRHMSILDFSSYRIDEETTDPKELQFYQEISGKLSRRDSRSASLCLESEQQTNETYLDSALEDYKLFTKEGASLNSPDTPSLTFSEISGDLEQRAQIPSLPLLPSFSSIDSMKSSESSVLQISNTIWVGSTIFDEDEATEKNLDAFAEIDAREVFNEKYMETPRSGYKDFSLYRTSLFFG